MRAHVRWVWFVIPSFSTVRIDNSFRCLVEEETLLLCFRSINDTNLFMFLWSHTSVFVSIKTIYYLPSNNRNDETCTCATSMQTVFFFKCLLQKCNNWWRLSLSFKFMVPGPLFTKKTPSYGYRDPHYKPKTVWRPSHVYNGNPYTDKTASSWIEAQPELHHSCVSVCLSIVSSLSINSHTPIAQN